MDVDHFKAINDTYGHSTGDAVLKRLAGLCAGAMRQSDIFGRYGGEEFVAILPETDLEGAMILAEQLRKAIETLVIDGPVASVAVTISLGVTAAATKDSDIAHTIGRADEALYQAKNQGRNCVVAQ